MAAFTPFDPNKHPRGFAGRFSGNAANTPVHPLRESSPTRPDLLRRLHAVTPTLGRRRVEAGMFRPTGAIIVHTPTVPHGE